MEQEQLSSTFGCTNCGADLHYEPGTTDLKCGYCGTENHIDVDVSKEIEELDFLTNLATAEKESEQLTINAIKCNACGSTSSIEKNLKSALCPYCSNALIIEDAHEEHFLKPKSLLPFKLDKNEALNNFSKWIKKLWFAPNALKKAILDTDRFKGVYLPFWTYDSDTFTKYTGQRGEYYYVNESYTTTENGKMVTKTRRVRKTRWYFTSGRVSKFFDDVLVGASESMPRKYIDKLEPWDLENLIPFDERFLSGYITEKYQTNLETGFGIAKDYMAPEIDRLIRRDIGGDEQRILSKNTKYSEITFKHLLLPAYISAFRFKEKLFRFVVNARTGEVQGERPWSTWKIAIAVLFGLIAIGIIYLFASGNSELVMQWLREFGNT